MIFLLHILHSIPNKFHQCHLKAYKWLVKLLHHQNQFRQNINRILSENRQIMQQSLQSQFDQQPQHAESNILEHIIASRVSDCKIYGYLDSIKRHYFQYFRNI